MKTNQSWVSAHPIKAVLFSLLFGSITTGFAIMWYAGELTLKEALCWLALVIAMKCTIEYDQKTLAVLLCCALWPTPVAAQLLSSPEPRFEPDISLLFTPLEDYRFQPAVGPAACAAAVLVIGGVAYYFMSEFCKKHFPKTPTNGLNQTDVQMGDDYAASCSFSPCGSCLMAAPDQGGGSNLLFELTGQVTETANGVAVEIVSTRFAGQDELVSAAEYHEALNRHGITLATFATEPIYSYGHNGQPADAEDVPIRILPPAGPSDVPFVVMGKTWYGLHPVFLERSTNLVNWVPISKSFVPIGMKMVFSDISTAERAFYRLKIPD